LLDGGQIIYQGTPSGLVSAAIGQVFQVAVSEMEFANIESQYEVVSTSVGSGSIVVRGVSHTDQLPDGAEIVQEPSLEESYMAFMAARGRSGVASQAEEHIEDDAAMKASK
jgi:hypothetical protein